MIWNYDWNVEDFASLHKEVYQDDLELCWNSRASKSACKSTYNVSEFGRTCNY